MDKVTKKQRFDKYRAPGSMGYRTESLFADVMEWKDKEKSEKAPLWLWRNKTGDSRPCLRDWFLHFEDPTGYEVAVKFLGNTDHWTKMYEASPWFREAVDSWNKELRMRLNARAMEAVLKIMEDEDAPQAQRLSAAKFVVSQAKDKTEASPRGRPSKEELKGNLKKHTDVLEQTDEDWDRITRNIN